MDEKIHDSQPKDPTVKLLTNLVEIIKEGQAANRKNFENHAGQIAANREALAALTQLLNAQTKAFNILREVLLHLWTDRYPEMPFPDATVN
jgi:hypothetical protein